MGKYYKTDCHIPYFNTEDHYDYDLYVWLYEGVKSAEGAELGLFDLCGNECSWAGMLGAHFLDDGLFIQAKERTGYVIDVKKTLEKMKVEFPKTIILN